MQNRTAETRDTTRNQKTARLPEYEPQKLTEKGISALPLPGDGKQITVWDAEEKGFGVRLNFSSKAYVVQTVRSGHDIKRTIGRAGPGGITLKQARATAKDWLVRIRKGDDPKPSPRARKAPVGTTFADARAEFLADYARRRKPRSLKEVERHLQHPVVAQWVNKGLLDITDDDVRNAFNIILKAIEARAVKLRAKRERLDGDLAIGRGVHANRWLSAVSALYRWAGKNWRTRVPGIKDHNPAGGWGNALRVEEPGRERGIDEADLPKIWRGVLARGRLWGRFYRLLLLLGCRRRELDSLKWSEVKDLAGTDPHIDKGSFSKAGHKVYRRIPLAPQAVALLARVPNTGPYVFGGMHPLPSRGNIDRAIRRSTGLAYSWQPHSFRACIASWAAKRGEPASIVEVVLGHVTAYRQGAMKAYIDELPRADHRRLLDAWAEHLRGIGCG